MHTGCPSKLAQGGCWMWGDGELGDLSVVCWAHTCTHTQPRALGVDFWLFFVFHSQSVIWILHSASNLLLNSFPCLQSFCQAPGPLQNLTTNNWVYTKLMALLCLQKNPKGTGGASASTPHTNHTWSLWPSFLWWSPAPRTLDPSPSWLFLLFYCATFLAGPWPLFLQHLWQRSLGNIK